MLRQANNTLEQIKVSLTRHFNGLWSSSSNNTTIEEVTENYFSLLSQLKYKQLKSFYGSSILNGETTLNNINRLYASLRKDHIQSYDVLLQYKIPFSKLGTENFLTYTKLSTRKGSRYMALWVCRNLNSRQAWKINDIYLHEVSPELALGVNSHANFDQRFITLCGQMIDDSTLTSLFFVRLFTDRSHSSQIRKSLSNSQGYQREIVETVKGQTEELLNILHNTPTTFSMSVLSPQLRERVRDLHSSSHDGYPILDGPDQADRSLKLLSLSVLPNHSQRQTRILAHVYMPKQSKYLSIWFKRTLNGELSWKVDDFYIHQFNQVNYSTYVDKNLCQRSFQTMKSRIFYAADLMGKYIVTHSS